MVPSKQVLLSTGTKVLVGARLDLEGVRHVWIEVEVLLPEGYLLLIEVPLLPAVSSPYALLRKMKGNSGEQA